MGLKVTKKEKKTRESGNHWSRRWKKNRNYKKNKNLTYYIFL